ncbi:MAG: hypothetical protein GWP20_01310, partial [Thermotogales bacterium]|nr:hypothetical protein [Thermotogales bacterium]
WFSYDYGQSQTAGSGGAPAAQNRDSEQRIEALEKERDTLKQQVADLERNVRQANQAISAAQARLQVPQRTTATPSTDKAPAPTSAVTKSEALDNSLKLENVRIEQTESDNVFRIGFSVLRAGYGSGRVTGAIWIAVNGFSNGTPKRLSFRALSPDRRLIVKMGFDQQQDVLEDVVLPDNFRPKNILIEAKPYGDDYTSTSIKITWRTTR